MAFWFSAGDAAFGAAAGFLVGVFAASLAWRLGGLFLAFLLTSIIFCFRNRTFYLKEFLLVGAAIGLGVWYYHFFLHLGEGGNLLPADRKIKFIAVVTDEPQPGPRYDLLPLTPVAPKGRDIKLFAFKNGGWAYGDLLAIEGTVAAPGAPEESAAIFTPKIKLLAHHRGFWLKDILINAKNAILGKFRDVLPEEQAALLGGIAFGSKENFSPELKQALALSGTTHLVAVSGYNITIVAVTAEKLFGNLLSKKMTFFLTSLLIMLFVMMTGVQASAVRAAIMGFLALFAKELGRPASVRNAIAASALGMALFDPTILSANIGFQLSFLSLLGLVYVEPALRIIFRLKDEGLFSWKDTALTTLSAQLGVLPIIVHAFGIFSATAIFANILVLGTVPLTMFFGFLLAALGAVSASLGFFAAKCASFLLAYQLGVIRLFGRLAVPLPITFESTFSILLYYFLLGAAIIYIQNKYGTLRAA